jgi:hypothetical protein
MYKKVFGFFDRLEDKVRGRLSRSPLLYALIGGVGIVLFWRGVWHLADSLPIISNSSISIVVGTTLLLISGIFVSAFVGNRLIMTGLRGEKKLAERTEEVFETEEMKIENIQTSVKKMEKEMKDIQNEIHEHHPNK